ncbi:hypothetical protein B0H17DRAFT_1096682, partial [Mycena rosella]
MIETSIFNSRQWQDMSFGLPFASFTQLDIPHLAFPILRSISFDIADRDWGALLPNTIVIQDAPLLREAHIHTLPHLTFDIPWHQLTALALSQSV